MLAHNCKLEQEIMFLGIDRYGIDKMSKKNFVQELKQRLFK